MLRYLDFGLSWLDVAETISAVSRQDITAWYSIRPVFSYHCSRPLRAKHFCHRVWKTEVSRGDKELHSMILFQRRGGHWSFSNAWWWEINWRSLVTVPGSSDSSVATIWWECRGILYWVVYEFRNPLSSLTGYFAPLSSHRFVYCALLVLMLFFEPPHGQCSIDALRERSKRVDMLNVSRMVIHMAAQVKSWLGKRDLRQCQRCSVIMQSPALHHSRYHPHRR